MILAVTCKNLISTLKNIFLNSILEQSICITVKYEQNIFV